MANSDKVQYTTVIRHVKGEDTFTIRTSDRKLKNRLHGYDLEPDDENGSTETFEDVPGNWLRIQRPRQFTEEELEATRERLSKALGRDKPKKGKKAAKPKAKPEPEDEEDDEEDEDEVAAKRKAKAKPAAKGKGKAKPAADEEDDDEIDDDPDDDGEEDDEDDDEPVEIVKKKKGKPAAKKK